MKRLLVGLLFVLGAFAQSAGVGNIWTFLGPTTLQSGATANGNGTAMAVAGLSSAIFTVNCSVACSGGTTVNLEGTADNTNYVALEAVQVGTATIAGAITNQGTTVTLWQVPIGALQSIRSRISAYSAGTITVTATASAAPWDPKTVNANQFLAGTAIDGNSGNKSAATQRVVIATDQPQLTNKLLVTPDANSAVNVGQVAGSTVDTNSGNKSSGTQRMVLATDQPNLTTPLNENVAQINGVAPLMGNGVTGTGSQRVTVASDNTAFSVNATLGAETTKVIGTARVLGNGGATLDSAPAATAPANTLQVGGTFTTTPTTLTTGQAGSLQLTAAQNLKSDISTLAGTATDTNSGSKSAGTLRVVLATDQPQLTNKLLVTPDANSAINVAQINGVTPLMGNGTTGTGSQRVTIASDNTAFSVNATLSAETTKVIGTVRATGNAGAAFDGATGSAVPANALYVGTINHSGNLTGDIQCDQQKIYDASTNGNTELVAISGSTHVYVCGYTIFSAGTVNVSLVAGTGTACASSASGTPSTGTSGASAGLTPAWQFTTQTGIQSAWAAHGFLFDAGSANALCLKTSAGVAVQAEVYYAQR